MNQTGGIGGANLADGPLDGHAVAALVAHGPENHAGAVDVPLYHALNAVVDGCLIVRAVGQQRNAGIVKVVVRGQGSLHAAVGLDIRLVNHIEAQLVA